MGICRSAKALLGYSPTKSCLHTLTSIFICNDLCLVVDRVCNRAVGVAEGDTDSDTVTRLRAGPSNSVLTHLGGGVRKILGEKFSKDDFGMRV